MSEWISISDKSPENGVDVLVTGFNFGTGPDRHYCVARRVYDDDDYFYVIDDEEGVAEELRFIDYWMPLPEAPVASNNSLNLTPANAVAG